MCALRAAWAKKAAAKVGTYVPDKQGGHKAHTHK